MLDNWRIAPRRWHLLVLAASLAGTLPGVAQARTLKVDDDRGQCHDARYRDLRKAVGRAKAGDVVAVCAGTYAVGDGLRITRGITLRGVGADLVRIEASAPKVAAVVAVDGRPDAPIDATIFGVTIAGGGAVVDHGVTFTDAGGALSSTRVTDVVTSEAADAYRKPGGWRSATPGIGVAMRGSSRRTLVLEETRVERYNRIGVLVDGAGNRAVLRADQVVGRVVCQNFPADGNCSAPTIVSDGPLFGQDGVRVTGGAAVEISDSELTQNLVEGSGAPSAGSPVGATNLVLGAGLRLIGAAASSIHHSNVVDNGYGAINLAANGSSANTSAPLDASDNWWGLWGLSPVNAGPGISPAVPPMQPENPVNGLPVPDTAGGITSNAVDFFPFRSGSQSDPDAGQWPLGDAPGDPTTPAPAGCTPTLQYDPAIPTFTKVVGSPAGGFLPAGVQRHPTADLWRYQEALVAATASSSRVRVIEKDLGPTTLGDQRLKIVVVGTPEHIARLETDARFWSGVVSGRVSAKRGIAAARKRPIFGWVTATPHGNEPAAGEATERLLYELVARTDCANARRLHNLDVFIDPARNPNGRDQPGEGQRLTPWGFDPNRDFATRTQLENQEFMPQITTYPGPFFIDAHQQLTGYFFPPNEDPVLHEISHFSLDLIQRRIGPALQRVFNDQSAAYRNYNSYDLFTPEYGDTVPSLIMGAAGMTYEKGAAESYGKQVYDHYVAMDTTVNVVSDDKVALTKAWVKQWKEAVQQGAACKLQGNVLVSPLHTKISQQPVGKVCGYFYKPGLHSGDVAKLIADLQSTGVNVYRLRKDTKARGVHEFGPGGSKTAVLPKGTLWIPLAQPMKHWIQALLGENPFIPFPYYYDVVTWSYSLNRGLAGDGVLTRPLPKKAKLKRIGAPAFGTAPATAPRYDVFATDSMAGLGLVFDLLEKGAVIRRAAEPFDAGGVHYPTGTAVVTGSSVPADVLASLAAARQTPVQGLDGIPDTTLVPVTRPKIGIYTGLPVEPPNPKPIGDGITGYCTTSVGLPSTYCEALFVLQVKDRIPASMLAAVTDRDLPGLAASGITALIDPNLPMGASAALQAFVNAGGTFVATGANGVTSARSAGLTLAATTSISGLLTPGATFQGSFNTKSPAAWGFDEGGWIYRSSSDDPVFDPGSLSNGAVAAVSYAKPGISFGYEVNAVGPGRLDGTPAVVDQPLGAGRSVLIGFNPFFRAWHESSERLVLDAVLHPPGSGQGRPLPRARLRPVAPRPAVTTHVERDVRIALAPGQEPAARRAVAAAALPAAIAGKVAFARQGAGLLLLVRGVRDDDYERRADWVGRLLGELRAHGVRWRSAQV